MWTWRCAALITRQLLTHASVQVEPRQLAATNGRVPDVLVGGYECAASGLRLGDLAGNLFTIVLREVPAGSRDAVRAAVAAVRATGFLNYFGLQRFGQGAVPTHAIGEPPPRAPFPFAVCMHVCHSDTSVPVCVSVAVGVWLLTARCGHTAGVPRALRRCALMFNQNLPNSAV